VTPTDRNGERVHFQLMRLLLGVILLAGCKGGPTQREPDEYVGCAADEQWRTFDDNEPTAMVSATAAPMVTAPPNGMTFPADKKPTLAWSHDASDPGMAVGDVPFMNGPGCMNCCPQFNIGALTALHLPAISGSVYDLQLTVDGVMTHRAITTLQEWTPPDAWFAAQRGKTVHVKIYRMALLKNEIKEGPFTSGIDFTFSVAN
jgi:hypothetical protein